MASTQGAVLKEIQRLLRNVGKLTDEQATISDVDSGDEEEITFYLTLSPNGGYYEGASCKFKVTVPTTYPETPPNVLCMNQIYHPNIDLKDEGCSTGSSVCVNLLDSDWQPGVGLDGCIMALLFLLYNPALDDALSPLFDGEEDLDVFQENVRLSIRGGEVEGVIFDKLVSDDDDDDNKVEAKDKAEAKKDEEGANEVNGVTAGEEGVTRSESNEKKDMKPEDATDGDKEEQNLDKDEDVTANVVGEKCTELGDTETAAMKEEENGFNITNTELLVVIAETPTELTGSADDQTLKAKTAVSTVLNEEKTLEDSADEGFVNDDDLEMVTTVNKDMKLPMINDNVGIEVTADSDEPNIQMSTISSTFASCSDKKDDSSPVDGSEESTFISSYKLSNWETTLCNFGRFYGWLKRKMRRRSCCSSRMLLPARPATHL